MAIVTSKDPALAFFGSLVFTEPTTRVMVAGNGGADLSPASAAPLPPPTGSASSESLGNRSKIGNIGVVVACREISRGARRMGPRADACVCVRHVLFTAYSDTPLTSAQRVPVCVSPCAVCLERGRLVSGIV